MGEPGIPTATDDAIELPCGRSVPLDTFDLGMRELACPCGERHAVVMDVHPLSRWIPEDVEEVLAETTRPTDEYDTFGTIHLMGMVLEEFPDRVVVHDASEEPSVGWRLLWVTGFGPVELHELVVELLVELMDHAVGHASDESVHREFADQLEAFDIGTFVAQYRARRDFESPGDRAA